MTRTTLPRDLVSLLSAVDASPDDTDTQLVLADWLEENGDADRSEYIRAKVKLSQPCPLGWSDKRHVDVYCPECDPPHSRADALLAANLPRWVPAAPCPGCHNKGRRTKMTCRICGGSGDALTEPNQWGHAPATRIDPDLDFYGTSGGVPWVWGVGCRLGEVVRADFENVRIDAHGDRVGTMTEPRVSRWAEAVLAACPTVRGFRVTDREPYHNSAGHYLWLRDSWVSQGGATRNYSEDSTLPDAAFYALEGDIDIKNRSSWRTYPTAALARCALSRALYSLVAKGGTPP